jgi:hypothetical protein
VGVALGEAGVAANHEAETVVLSVPSSTERRPYVPPRGARLYHRTHGARGLILMLVLIFVSAFATVKVVSCLSFVGDNPPEATRADAPVPEVPAPEAAPDVPAPDSPPATSEFLAARLEAFRAALDASGNSGVHFRMIGDTMELWGTVPSAADKAMVQMLALNVAGVASLKDRIRVQNGPAGP